MPEAMADIERLRDDLAEERFDAVHCSDLTRCRQTLAAVRETLPTPEAWFDARLRELDFGDYEGCTYAHLKDDPGYRAWVDSAGAVAPPNGESAAACGHAWKTGWRRYRRKRWRRASAGYWR